MPSRQSISGLHEPAAGYSPHIHVGRLMRIAPHGFMTRGDGFSAEVGRRTREQVNVLMRLGFDDAQSDVRRSEDHPDIWDLNSSLL